MGERLKYESCQTEDCHHALDIRLEQCRAFDGNNFKIDDLPSLVQWVPKYRESKHHCPEMQLKTLFISWRRRQVQALLPGGVLQCILPLS